MLLKLSLIKKQSTHNQFNHSLEEEIELLKKKDKFLETEIQTYGNKEKLFFSYILLIEASLLHLQRSSDRNPLIPWSAHLDGAYADGGELNPLTHYITYIIKIN